MGLQREVPSDFRTPEEAAATRVVGIVAELPKETALQLALFVDRLTLETLIAHTDAHLPEAERERLAYLMRDGLEAAVAGYRV